MKKLTLALLLICNLCLFGCSTDSETLKERDEIKLNKMYNGLIDLSESQTRPCTNPDEWAYVKIANICGSYDYMIYSKK